MSFESLKYNFFLKFFQNKKKLIWTLKNNLFENEVCPPTISVVKLSKNTILGKKMKECSLLMIAIRVGTS